MRRALLIRQRLTALCLTGLLLLFSPILLLFERPVSVSEDAHAQLTETLSPGFGCTDPADCEDGCACSLDSCDVLRGMCIHLPAALEGLVNARRALEHENVVPALIALAKNLALRGQDHLARPGRGLEPGRIIGYIELREIPDPFWHFTHRNILP